MSVFKEINKRRVLPWLGAYIAGGFLALEAVDQLVGNGLLPQVAYPVALTFYLFAIPGTAILAWYHGEKGQQKPLKMEIWLQGGLFAAALTVSVLVVRGDRAAARAMEFASSLGLDPRDVAVLYFEDRSDDGDLEHVADGLTESLIEQLDRVGALEVISRNGTAPYRGTELAPDSIARSLSVGSLITGSVDLDGDELRVTANLLDGASGADIDRTTLTIPADQAVAAGDSVALRVAGFFRQVLGEEIEVRERRAETESIEAWSFVQRAEGLRKQGAGASHHDLEAAVAAFEQADSVLAIAEMADPEWAEPTRLRAEVAYEAALVLIDDSHAASEWIRSGIEHAERAIEQAPGEAEALAWRGILRFELWYQRGVDDPEEWDRLLVTAQEDLESAISDNPSQPEAHLQLSYLYYQTDDLPAALMSARAAYEEDAYLRDTEVTIWRLFFGSLDLEQFPNARRWCQVGETRFPDDWRFARCNLWLLASPAVPADVDGGWRYQEKLTRLAPEGQREFTELEGQVLAAANLARAELPDSARSVLMRVREASSHDVDPTQELLQLEAFVRTILGDYDEAIDLLKAYQAANPEHSFAESHGTTWHFRELRSHSRFEEVTAGRH